MTNRNRLETTKLDEEDYERRCIDSVIELLHSGMFYYSTEFDLSKNFQRQLSTNSCLDLGN
jgi:hypothetical protein